MSENLWKKIFF